MISRKTLALGLTLTRRYLHRPKTLSSNIPQAPQLDVEYLCDPRNVPEIKENIAKRKGVGNIQLVHELKNKLGSMSPDDTFYKSVKKEFEVELLKIPNRTHPEVAGYGNDPKLLKEVGEKPPEGVKYWEFQDIVKKLKLVRTDQLGNFCGGKSYFLLGEMAELEHALVRYITSKLIRNKFDLVSVPDILPRDVIEGCGMNTRGTRTQVYTLDESLHGPDLCLSGTSEMALAGYLSQKTLPASSLPLKLAAISRCYRAETSNLLEERGIYRVHEFTKVEMFIVSHSSESDQILSEILSIEEEFFTSLGLHFKVLDMPPHELGAQAYRKYDIEAWLAGRGLYGEVSSCSNCLDFQARRLGIKSEDGFVHTLNGTACAIPRLLIALVEKGQNKNGTISVPEVLWPFLGGKKVLGKQKSVPELKLLKTRK